MPLFDYICRQCKHRFEQLVRGKDDADAGVCPACSSRDSEVQIPRFRIGGRGDLRETTEFHGCHPAESEHVHSSGCSHGSNSAKDSENT